MFFREMHEPSTGTSLSCHRRSPGTSARYWENVKRFPGFYSESIFSSDYNGLKIHRHLLLFRCFILYFLLRTTLSELCKNYTTTPVLVL